MGVVELEQVVLAQLDKAIMAEAEIQVMVQVAAVVELLLLEQMQVQAQAVMAEQVLHHL
jgi:hypothetical protein